jgi:hypothetical protein
MRPNQSRSLTISRKLHRFPLLPNLLILSLNSMSQLQALADTVTRLHAQWTSDWHDHPSASRSDLPWSIIEYNHRMNFDLWHEEDIARRDDLGAERVRQAKRNIDGFNQRRNDAIERMDSWFLSSLAVPAEGPLHSETPGMIVDRLSILALKLYHMQAEADRASAAEEHRRKCSEKAAILKVQLGDLAKCLDELLGQLQAGTRRFKVYRQFKMYNDATLNPQLYSKATPEKP